MDTAGWKWFQLVLLCMAPLGVQVSYDSIGAAGPYLRQEFGLNAESIGDLYSAYHFPNIVLAAFGGVLTDRIGAGPCSLLCALCVLVGTAVVAQATTVQRMMVGRLLVGVGGETLLVAQLALLDLCFGEPAGKLPKGVPSFALAFALQLAVTRAATLAVFLFLPPQFFEMGMKAEWIVVGVTAVSVCAILVFLGMVQLPEPQLNSDFAKKREHEFDMHEEDNADALREELEPLTESYSHSVDDFSAHPGQDPRRRKASALDAPGGTADKDPSATMHPHHVARKEHGRSQLAHCCWVAQQTWTWQLSVLAGFLVVWSSIALPFVDFATVLFVERWGFTIHDASRTTTYLTTAGMTLLIPFGFLVDKYNGHVRWLLAGICVAIPAHLTLLLSPSVPPAVACAMLGTAGALVASSMWPLITLEVPPKFRGTSLGLLMALQNWALCFAPTATGALRDHSGSYDAVLVWLLCLDAVAFVLALVLLMTTNPEWGGIRRVAKGDEPYHAHATNL